MYKTFIITLLNTGVGDHQVSAQAILPHTLSCCDKHGSTPTIVDGVYGYTLKDSTWESYGFKVPSKPSKKITKFANLPGAQGCFLSHYQLWNQCVELDEPVVILEDDAEILAPMPVINTDKDLIKFHEPRHMHYHNTLGNWAPGAFAYWLSPAGAKKLIKFSKNYGPGHADKLIGSNILNWDYLEPNIVTLGPRIGSSTNPIRYPYRDTSLGL